MAITSSAAMTSTTGTALTSLAVNATAANDLWVVCVIVKNSAITTTGISSALSTGWVNVTGNWLDGASANESIWVGQMTGSGADTLNLTFSGSMAGVGIDIDAHPFHSSFTNPVWTPNVFGFQSNAASTTVAFPPLQADLGGNLYWGHARVPTSASTPAPAGFISNPDANGNPEMYNLSLSAGTASPTLQQASGVSNTIAITVSDFAGPQVKQVTTTSGTSTNATFTLASNPQVGDLMEVWLATTTPLSIHAPLISTTNIQDQWVPLFGAQDAQQHDVFAEGGLRLYCFYKTANATDATTNVFTFTFLPYADTSGQAGVPQFPTTDFVGVLATFQTNDEADAGLDTTSPRSHQPNRNSTVFGLPSVDTNGGSDVFWSVIAGLKMGTPTSTDPSASVVASATLASPVYASVPLALYLFGSSVSGLQYPFQFTTSEVPTAVLTALTGIQDAQNWYYNGPFARIAYDYEGPDQQLIRRYPTHWAYTVLKTAGVITIGQFFSQDQLNAADVVYYQNQLIPEADRDAILAAGVGGDFRPSIQVPGPYVNPWKYVPI